MKRLEIRAAAQRDLIEIRDYSIEQFGPEVAAVYLADIREAFVRIRDFPEIGSVYPGIKPEIRVLAIRSHRIFYQSGQGRVTIVRLLHRARDAKRLMS